jgi:hypothetical protein
MAVVAGLFSSQADATRLMDVILRRDFEGLDTRVIEGNQPSGNMEQGVEGIFPVIPTTGSGVGQPAGIPWGAGDESGWMSEMREVERTFYLEGMREGATLALIRVDDEHVDEVRKLMDDHGAQMHMDDTRDTM